MRALILIFVVMTTVTAKWGHDSSYYPRPLWSKCDRVQRMGLCLFDDPLNTFISSKAKALSRQCCRPSDAVGKAFIISKNGDRIVKRFNEDFMPMDFDSCDVSGEKFCPKCCQVNGNWGHWSPYSPCSKSCGTGVATRTRKCDSPAPANGGKDCEGMATQTQGCNTQLCPAELCASFGYQYDSVTSICIKVFQTHENFFGAEKMCEEDSAVLLKLDSTDKRDFLQTVVAGDSSPDFIIGAIDIGGDNFQHLDGTPVVWIGTLPTAGTQDCVRYNKQNQEMDETPCATERKFICERNVTPL